MMEEVTVLQKNFPGRKNARRIRALERLQAQTGTGHDGRQTRHARDCADELNALTLRILPQDRAEAIRTKKDRSGRGKLSRAA